MEGIFIISAIISLIISYFIIYSAVKNALSNELKKTNELLEKVLKQGNEVFDLNPTSENIQKTKNIVNFLTLSGDKLIIKTKLNTGYEIGDSAFIGDKLAKDGKYKLSLFDSIVVENGKVVK
ncbi:hypothetical protein SAMN05443634_105205 [Chishuiella changwenlii]|uniref:Uncharacterized protein n=1 Tax=Chishuiella changwenlii TaxID=1434701 RepID=A0A1M6XCY3_9FLAO|nr:hypothetical protein [Chishuiella changwenlii]GGF00481.1 hypothetical protein GCM10010984_17580 [Chishuiella changwenlii]SHL03870.1 hypothetical protein SAMN05443634_105205 [Chishuiella changwenlii]